MPSCCRPHQVSASTVTATRSRSTASRSDENHIDLNLTLEDEVRERNTEMVKQKIAVIGAGVIGLSIARSLALAGVEVTIFERERIGAGTSTKTFAWVNSNGKNPESYHALNLDGLHRHIRLQAAGPSEGQWFRQTGTYEWAVKEQAKERLETRVSGLKDRDYAVTQVSADEITARIPELLIDPRSGNIWYFPEEGYVEMAPFLARLWDEARRNGVQLRTPVEVVDVEEGADAVSLRLNDGSTWSGDQVVFAAGRWSSSLLGMLGQTFAMIDADAPNKIACGFLGYTNPQLVQLASNIITPDMNIRPDGGGRLLLQTPDLDHRADPAYQADTTGLIAQEMLRRLSRVFRNVEGAQVEKLKIGQRARPADGKPAIGFVDGFERCYVAAMHSGVTLSLTVGALVSEELVKGRRDDLLTDFAPTRLLNKSVEDFPVFSTIHFPAAQ
ncbi:NAD(P)/FAD-dependent oxidoreductase [Microbacterium pseudoresistens]